MWIGSVGRLTSNQPWSTRKEDDQEQREEKKKAGKKGNSQTGKAQKVKDRILNRRGILFPTPIVQPPEMSTTPSKGGIFFFWTLGTSNGLKWSKLSSTLVQAEIPSSATRSAQLLPRRRGPQKIPSASRCPEGQITFWRTRRCQRRVEARNSPSRPLVGRSGLILMGNGGPVSRDSRVRPGFALPRACA